MKHVTVTLFSLTMTLLILACTNPAGGSSGDGVSNDYTSATIGTLKYVPAGQFQRDATPTNISVITQPFRMSRYEITRAQFLAVMGTDPSDPFFSSGLNDPVQSVNWYHVITFCNKLSIAEGLTPVYSVTGVDFETLIFGEIPASSNAVWDAAGADWNAGGYRLPTEMEWTWAAIGARDGTTGYLKEFAGSTGGNAVGDYAVYGYYSAEAGATTNASSSAAGSKLANELGIHDLSGNVWEWIWDWYGAYPSGTAIDYHGAAVDTSRVMKGASWGESAFGCYIALRSQNVPFSPNSSYGFRVVRL